ncbi:MAG: 2-hydroxychromene-2-carboxylate isomerase [Mesorhizobium sp.]|nr:2-hydroxychromene-2-carboxylate isomerase [Mesorhizobium sp.]MCO5160478.1 2-hydroxychromene-2-carboxylate isomerase [Mesorhizobium sp.]
MPTIDYYLTCISPWTYLGHRLVQDVARRHGAKLVVKPVNLGEMFKVSGQVALGERPAVRQRYRFIELQRFAEMRGRPLNPKPKFFPVNPTLADHTIIAILEAGRDPLAYMDAVFSAVWAEEKDISDEMTLASLLSTAGFDAAAILAKAKGPEVAAIRARNTQDAVTVDATGVPSYVLNGEPFWGQDRIDLLDRALSSGRAPFKPL